MICPRTILAAVNQLAIESAITIVQMLFSPMIARTMIANGRYGSPYSASSNRIWMLSRTPPAKPAIEP